MLTIGLQSEYVISVFGLMITNTFLTTFVTTLLLMCCGLLFYLYRYANENESVILKTWHILVYELLKLADSITGDRSLSKRLLPLLATLFLFIFVSNLIALLPGFLGSVFVETETGPVSLLRSPNSDLTTTLALAIVAVVSIQVFSISALGWRRYVTRFLNFSGVLPFILGLFELLSETLRTLSFSFRLFGNVFAGEVLLLVIAFLVPYVLPVPFMALEVFISLVQAFIFCILTLTFIRLSTQKHTGG